MSFKKVEDWLRSLGLICYAQAFYDNGYEDIEICQKIGDADLDVIGVKNAKDRNDILASLIRLQQGALYFELEPEEVVTLPQEREKLEPLLLKTKIKEELDKQTIKLNESPYFNLDGSFGDLRPLAERISYDLNAIFEDVLEALDQLRRRQLPAEAYALLPEDNPQEYLNVETGIRSRRATSLSKYDSRITKSTSNLHETDLQDNKGPVVTHFKGQAKRTGGNKKHATGFSKFFQSMRRTRSPIVIEPSKKKSTSDINASEIDLSQEELKKLMMKVKNKELSQEDALDEVNRKMVTRVKSKSFDGDQANPVFDSSPEPSPKEKEEGQEKKRKEKMKKKKAGKSKKSGHSSTFYYGAIDDEPVADDGQQVQLTNITRSPLRSTSLSSQRGLGDEHGCDDSPELLNHNKDKSSLKDILKRSFRRNGRSPIHGEDSDAFRSNETLNSSTGSTHSSSQDSIVSGELQEGGSHNSSTEHPFGHLVPKSLKKPPPIPLREDIIQRSRAKIEDAVPSTDNQHRIVRQPSKSVPMPPPRNLPPEKADPVTVRRKENERTRSVTFDDSSFGSYGGDHTKSEKGHVPGTLSHVKPFMPGMGTVQDRTKAAPLPPPRSTAWKPDRDPSQPDSLNPPVAPPRLKRNQMKTHSDAPTADSSTTLNEGSAHDEERPKSLPENSRVGDLQARNWDQQPSHLNKDKNQNSLAPDGLHDLLAKSSSLDNDQSQKVLTPNGKPPILGEKPPIIKPKPFLPPRPLSIFTPPAANSAIDGKPIPPPRENGVSIPAVRPRELKHSSSTGRIVLNQISPDSESLAPIRPRPLKDLVKKKLRKESIEIAQKPYTTEEGHWNVPPALLHRYSEELEKPVTDVIAAMDSIRLDVLTEKRRPMIPCDVSSVIVESPQRVASSTIDEWLIEVGLPMFSEDFKEVGLTSFDTLQCFSEEDFKNIGVYDQRHLARLLMEIQKLSVV